MVASNPALMFGRLLFTYIFSDWDMFEESLTTSRGNITHLLKSIELSYSTSRPTTQTLSCRLLLNSPSAVSTLFVIINSLVYLDSGMKLLKT
ncbi:hypothetical protein NPIL_439361 [Nephila pilipes]|uniref:Uncharacterized protein n=1 Tax=Nephila pilipes TaxID=299642 RepID=A0A8X6M9U4_NEPPI|nr:hypothetical protein NPIL_439361 [Nephila pilipes]